MKLIVTGSSGTIGSRLIEKTLDNHTLFCVDKRDNKWISGIDTNIIDLRHEVKRNVDGDIAILLAANARVDMLVKNPVLAMDNFNIVFNSLEMCRKNDISNVIFASSREAYGNSDKIIHSEDESYIRMCESPYTATKIGGEALLHSYQQCYGINFIIIRYSNVYGMYDDSDRVMPKFIGLARENKPLPIFGESKLLDYTYIDDAIDGTIRCIDRFTDVKNNVFNIASGSGVSIVRTAELIRDYMNSKSEIKILPSNIGEVNRYVANLDKAKALLGYNPQETIESGIEKTIKWYDKWNI